MDIWNNYLQQRQADKEAKELDAYKRNMEGKNFKQLTLQQQNWIYNNNRQVYMNLINEELENYVVPENL